jgi:hypothetical protein
LPAGTVFWPASWRVPGLESVWLRHQRFLLIPAGRYV